MVRQRLFTSSRHSLKSLAKPIEKANSGMMGTKLKKKQKKNKKRLNSGNQMNPN